MLIFNLFATEMSFSEGLGFLGWVCASAITFEGTFPFHVTEGTYSRVFVEGSGHHKNLYPLLMSYCIQAALSEFKELLTKQEAFHKSQKRLNILQSVIFISGKPKFAHDHRFD